MGKKFGRGMGKFSLLFFEQIYLKEDENLALEMRGAFIKNFLNGNNPRLLFFNLENFLR